MFVVETVVANFNIFSNPYIWRWYDGDNDGFGSAELMGVKHYADNRLVLNRNRHKMAKNGDESETCTFKGKYR